MLRHSRGFYVARLTQQQQVKLFKVLSYDAIRAILNPSFSHCRVDALHVTHSQMYNVARRT